MSSRVSGVRLFLLAAGAAVALPAAMLPTALAGTTDGSAWAVTATRAEPAVPGATLVGSAPPGMPMRVAVALELRNKPVLDHVVSNRQTITADQFQSAFAPTAAQDSAVAGYLRQAGLTNVQIEPGGMLVSATGTAATVESAFHTKLDRYSIAGRSVFANVAPASVPSRLGPYVASVLGLQDVVTITVPKAPRANANQLAASRTAAPPDPNNIGALYTPPDMWKFYDATTVPAGSKTPIAIFAEGNLTDTIKQLRLQEAAYKLPVVPVQVVPVGPASPDTSADVEWKLDTQSSTGMADGVAKLVLYDTTTLSDTDISLEFSRFAAAAPGTATYAKAGSASFGECEYQAFLDGAMLAVDQAFEEAAAQGKTMFVSSGDQGGFCPYVDTNGIGPGGPPGESYPASSPYAVAVGGTSLLSNTDFSYNTETVWYTSGGGISDFESPPFWEAGVAPNVGTVCPPAQGAVSCGRALPDVAMDADALISPGVYYDGGQPNGQGGTSLASPLSLGTWARLESAHYSALPGQYDQLGFAAPLLYGAYQSTGFHDIVVGDSGPYPATPGFDYATGMGSFDVAQMEKDIVKPPPPPISGPTTFYLHGSAPLDETDSYPEVSANFLSMDPTVPTGSVPDTHEITSYVAGPNTDCAGNNFFPVWLGKLHGTVTGTVTLTLNTVSSPAAQVEVDLWPDVASQVCVSNLPGGSTSLPPPIGSQVVALPAGSGSVTVTFQNVNTAVAQNLMLQVKPVSGPNGTVSPMVARAVYDATSYESALKLTCTPAKGTTSC